MTTTMANPLSTGSIYAKSVPVETPLEQSPDSVIGTVDHFSKLAELFKYLNTEGVAEAGRVRIDEVDSTDFWCVIKPLSRRGITELVKDDGGDYTSGRFILYYNPFHPFHPPEGVHLEMGSDKEGILNISDVICYNKRWWIVTAHDKLDVDNGQEKEVYIGKALIETWNRPAHVLDDTPEAEPHYVLD